MIRVLADFHHHALFESYRLLFEDRFGWEVYRPIGMAWFDEWIWSFERVYHGDKIAHQYLDPIPPEPERGIPGDIDRADWSERPDNKNPGRVYRMVTLDQARSQPWDIVISSVPANDHGFGAFARSVGARHGIQIGNQWQETEWKGADFALISSTGIAPPPIPHVVYHQEFSRDLFRHVPPDQAALAELHHPVRSFVNCFPETPEYPRFRSFAATAPEFPFEVYGAYGSAALDEFARGDVETTPDVATRMREAFVIWHAKYWSDGYGHAIHNAFALGRPVFGSARYYRDKLAGPLWVDGVTSVDVDRLGPDDVATELRRLRDDPGAYLAMCEAAAARFDEVVSFDADAEQVRAMLGAIL